MDNDLSKFLTKSNLDYLIVFSTLVFQIISIICLFVSGGFLDNPTHDEILKKPSQKRAGSKSKNAKRGQTKKRQIS